MTQQLPNEYRWQVTFEWNGEKPPSKIYNTISDTYGVTARGNRESGGMYLMQEGAALFTTQEAAVYFAEFLTEGVPVRSKDGNVKRHVPLYVSVHQIVQHTQFESGYKAKIRQAAANRSKKGRKTIQGWAITCRTEGETFYSEHAGHPVVCPHCKSPNIQSREGYPRGYTDPSSTKVVDDWMRMRFGQDRWERGIGVEPVDAPPLIGVRISEQEEQDAWKSIEQSGILDLIAIFDRDTQLELLDALLLGLAHWPQAIRMDARREAFTLAAIDGCNLAMLSLIEIDIDLLSAAGPIQPQTIVDLLNEVQEKIDDCIAEIEIGNEPDPETPDYILSIVKKDPRVVKVMAEAAMYN